MSSKKKRTGIILAGGKSSRMGTEKGLILLNRKTFVDHIIEALQPLVQEIIIVSSNTHYDKFGFKRIEDIITDAGPIAGIHAGLTHTKTNHNLIISCDTPLITTDLLTQLLPKDWEEFDINQFKANGKTIPLIAFYKKNCAQYCYELLEKGEKRLRKLVEMLNTKTISLSEKDSFLVKNINTQEDLNTIINEVDY